MDDSRPQRSPQGEILIDRVKELRHAEGTSTTSRCSQLTIIVSRTRRKMQWC